MSRCGSHQHAGGHSHAKSHAHHPGEPYVLVAGGDDACTCHVHVPAPGNEQLPTKQRGPAEQPEARGVVVAAAVIEPMVAEFGAVCRPAVALLRAEAVGGERAAALRATRLRI